MDELKSQLEHAFTQENSELEAHMGDKSYQAPIKPKCVIKARDDKDILTVLKYANEHQHPITIRGAGSGKSGGAIPEPEGIALSLEGYNKILECDIQNSCMVVQPGVIVDDIKAMAKSHGLFYPPDPSSSDWCTIGGCVAENAGGAAAIKYGVTGDYIMGLEGYFANGTAFKLGGKCHKDVAGYDLKRLLIGSEGTLAIITKIILKLIPMPKQIASFWCGFNTMIEASDFLLTMRQSGIQFSAAEFLQKKCLEAVESYRGESLSINKGEAFVLLRVDADTITSIEHTTHYIKDTLTQYEKAYFETNQDDLYWEVRHQTSEAIAHYYAHKVSEDITVPPSKVPEYLNAMHHLQEDPITLIGYGHLGDGNIHSNIVSNAFTKEEWESEKDKWINAIMTLCLSMGGTITGEHGVGLTKKKFLPRYFSPDEIQVMKQIKEILDPNNILNPSKMF